MKKIISLTLICFCLLAKQITLAQDGSLDLTFSGDGKQTTDIGNSYDYAYSVAIQGDGKIVVAGTAKFFSGLGMSSDFAIVRYNSDGNLDSTFSGDGIQTKDIGSRSDYGYSVAIQTDGKIVVAGFSLNETDFDFALVRYNSDGTLDNTFSEDGIQTTAIGSGNDASFSVAIQADGKIVVVGYAFFNGSKNDLAIVRYNSDGTLDNTFSGDGIQTNDIGGDSDEAYSVAIQPDGKIVVLGKFLYPDNFSSQDYDYALLRYNSDGSLDNSFSGDGFKTSHFGTNDIAHSVAIQSDGKILVSGYVETGPGYYDLFLFRYNSDGTFDNTFSEDGIQTNAIASTNAYASSVTLQTDGKIVVVGQSSFGGKNDFVCLRYNNDGTLDNNFGVGGKLTTDFENSEDFGYSVAIQNDGKIVEVGRSNGKFAVARYNGINTGIEENSSEKDIRLYPNPTTGKFIIDNRELKIEKVEVFNLLGEKIYQDVISNGARNLSIDLSNQAKGIYFVNCITDKGSQRVKVVKQ